MTLLASPYLLDFLNPTAAASSSLSKDATFDLVLA